MIVVWLSVGVAIVAILLMLFDTGICVQVSHWVCDNGRCVPRCMLGDADDEDEAQGLAKAEQVYEV